MPLKMKNLKFINKILVLVISIVGCSLTAQEEIKIEEKVPVEKNSETQRKVDGVVAVVGDYFILESDIDKVYIELQAQGTGMKNIKRCELLGKLLEDKLYAHHAVQDSIPIADSEINSMLDNQVSYMLEQLGTMDKVIAYFKKNSETELRTELFDIIKMNKLASKMQEKIIGKVDVTPEETKIFFNSIEKEDLPIFGSEMEIAQIVVKPKISEDDKQRVIDKLNSIRKDVLENGANFVSKAVLYSEDPGSRANGGFYKMNRNTPFVKEFKDVAFSMEEGEISEPFETEFGYHIIFLEKIRGRELDLRHILMMPAISNQSLKDAKAEIELIRSRIIKNEISFEEAAREFSDETETKNNGGQLINPKTYTTRFELTKMDPSLYSQVVNLKNNDVSGVLVDEDRSGRKSYKIIKVTNTISEHKADYSKDYTKIKELATKEKQIKAIGLWTTAKIEETFIKINPEYATCDFTNNWIKK